MKPKLKKKFTAKELYDIWLFNSKTDNNSLWYCASKESWKRLARYVNRKLK